MKKKLAVGLVAAGLIAAGGTGFITGHANEKAQDPVFYMQQRMANGQMTQMMNTANTGTSGEVQMLKKNPTVSFEEMLPYMKKMHPDLSDEQLKTLFEQMHGPDGACGNGQGMMGNKKTNFQ